MASLTNDDSRFCVVSNQIWFASFGRSAVHLKMKKHLWNQLEFIFYSKKASTFQFTETHSQSLITKKNRSRKNCILSLFADAGLDKHECYGNETFTMFFCGKFYIQKLLFGSLFFIRKLMKQKL